jgi:uncharacterized RDD family membrane protein YckC
MNNSFDTLNIDTPENVTFSYEIAGIGSRFLAALVDTLLLGLLEVIVIGTALLIFLQLNRSNSGVALVGSGSEVSMWALGILTFIAFWFFWGYYIFFEIFWNGQTPGKRFIGLRVIRMDGTPVTFSEVVIRNLVRTLDLLPMAYGVGVITMFINSKSCRLGDLAARTVVVLDSPASLHHTPIQVQNELSMLRRNAPLPADFPLEKISDQDMQVLDSFLSRRGQLANRKDLALYLLRSLYKRLELATLDPAFEADPEHALVVIYQAKQIFEAGRSEIK